MATYKAVDACKDDGYWFILESKRASSSRYCATKKLTESVLATLAYRSKKRYELVYCTSKSMACKMLNSMRKISCLVKVLSDKLMKSLTVGG